MYDFCLWDITVILGMIEISWWAFWLASEQHRSLIRALWPTSFSKNDKCIICVCDIWLLGLYACCGILCWSLIIIFISQTNPLLWSWSRWIHMENFSVGKSDLRRWRVATTFVFLVVCRSVAIFFPVHTLPFILVRQPVCVNLVVCTVLSLFLSSLQRDLWPASFFECVLLRVFSSTRVFSTLLTCFFTYVVNSVFGNLYWWLSHHHRETWRKNWRA